MRRDTNKRHKHGEHNQYNLDGFRSLRRMVSFLQRDNHLALLCFSDNGNKKIPN